MKSKFLILFVCTLILSPGCLKDVLDKKPLDRISDGDVWKSKDLIDLYLVPLYDNLPISFPTYPYLSALTDEVSIPYAGVTIVENYGNHALTLNTTVYTWIRRANYFLEKIKTSTISADLIKQYIAECRFIRAYYYFDLARKYGGMPLISDVQQFEGDIAPLLTPRNKEQEVYDFILAELNAAIIDLPESRLSDASNRVNKFSALALKSRAMLYAGSIARYGNVQLNGLIGIPGEKASGYFAEAMNAAREIMISGKYTLYTKLYNPAAKSGNPIDNFQQIFLDENNSEIIFQKVYTAPDKKHGYDTYNLPESFKPGCCGNSQAPTLELAESFEYKDGSPGTFNVEGKEFNTPEELFANKDPRFNATMFRSESPFLNGKVEIYRGIYDQNGRLYDIYKAAFPPDPSKLQVGKDGPYTLGDVGKTGFLPKKYLNATIIPAELNSDQNYIDFRYAEILLNFAEAAFENASEKTDVLDAINQIRARAGIKELALSDLTLDKIRNERKVELALEDKRFWDIRRWRIGTQLFRNTSMHGLWPYLKYNGSTYKYTFKVVSGAPIDNGRTRTFEEKDYYSNLAGYISSNKNIINNPGW